MNRRFQGSGGKTTAGTAKFIEGIPDNWKEVGYISCEGVMVIAGSESVRRSQSNGGITTNA